MAETQKAERFIELEGLRGIAAIIVALYHYSIAFYAFAFFSNNTTMATIPNTWFEPIIHGNPLMALVSGSFAVSLFFVLSGFVLSVGFFQTGKEHIIKKLAAKRYIRLMLPALASVILCYILIKLGLAHAQEAAVTTNSGWLGVQWNFAPHLIEAIFNGTWGIFTTSQSAYNNVLWTMTIEFAGSFLVFGALLIFGRSKHRWVLYTSLLAITINTWFLGFVFGMMLADLYASGTLQQKVRDLRIVLPLLALGIFFGGYPFAGTEGTIYAYLTVPQWVGTVNFVSLYTLIGAAIIVTVVITSTQVASVLAKKTVSRLGKYTFSLYLIHLPVLFTFTTFCFVHLQHHMGYNKAVALSLLASVPVVAGLAYLFERYVDSPSIRLSNYFAAFYMGTKRPQFLLRLVPANIKTRFAAKFQNRMPFTNTIDQDSTE